MAKADEIRAAIMDPAFIKELAEALAREFWTMPEPPKKELSLDACKDLKEAERRMD